VIRDSFQGSWCSNFTRSKRPILGTSTPKSDFHAHHLGRCYINVIRDHWWVSGHFCTSVIPLHCCVLSNSFTNVIPNHCCVTMSAIHLGGVCSNVIPLLNRRILLLRNSGFQQWKLNLPDGQAWPVRMVFFVYATAKRTLDIRWTNDFVMVCVSVSVSVGTVLCILNVGTWWRWGLSFTPRPFYPRRRKSAWRYNSVSYTIEISGSHGGLLRHCGMLSLRSQGRIKGFVGPRYFSLLGPFGDSTSIVGTTLYSRLSGLMEGEGMHG
jgi:hypothetical protein